VIEFFSLFYVIYNYKKVFQSHFYL
jgi:hypothetical protein